MAVVLDVLTLLALCGFLLAFASLGHRVLRALGFVLTSPGVHVLICVAVGLLITEVLFFFCQFTQRLRIAAVFIVVLLVILLFLEWRPVWAKLQNSLDNFAPPIPLEKVTLVALLLVVSMEFLSSMAPVTGSDALHYHFTVEKLVLQDGFRPPFSLSHGFLVGQHHLLILLGLALGSERLSMGFIFLGGILTALALASLVSRYASRRSALAFALLFLLTPVAFWQLSISGAPDIFMAFMACAALIVLCQQTPQPKLQLLVAGFLVGGVAGAKYTGVLIALAFFLSVVVEFKSLRLLSIFLSAALLSGIWPFLRNLLWTRDPIFPFLYTKLAPHLATSYGLTALRADTGGFYVHHLSELLPFLLFAGVRPSTPGLWEFFGPLVLVLAPLILLTVRNTRVWRIPLIVWLLSGVLIFYTSGLPRFLLPLYPIALFCVAAGWDATSHRAWKMATVGLFGFVSVLACVELFGLCVYSAHPILAACGFVPRAQYLEQSSQDYQAVAAINRLLAGQDPRRRTLVFLRHTYYLQIPYLNGNPETSFAIDPDLLSSAQTWKAFFEKNSIAFVVRSPEYPKAIAPELSKMENDGDLVPFAQLQVQNIFGKRVNAVRDTISVVVLRVKPPVPEASPTAVPAAR